MIFEYTTNKRKINEQKRRKKTVISFFVVAINLLFEHNWMWSVVQKSGLNHEFIYFHGKPNRSHEFFSIHIRFSIRVNINISSFFVVVLICCCLCALSSIVFFSFLLVLVNQIKIKKKVQRLNRSMHINSKLRFKVHTTSNGWIGKWCQIFWMKLVTFSLQFCGLIIRRNESLPWRDELWFVCQVRVQTNKHGLLGVSLESVLFNWLST